MKNTNKGVQPTTFKDLLSEAGKLFFSIVHLAVIIIGLIILLRG